MKQIILISSLSIMMINFSFGQISDKYTKLISEAMELYKNTEYLKSGQKFSEAFQNRGDKNPFTDRYNAACSWALANQLDSSFIQLFLIVENGNYTNLQHISSDADLESLHSDIRWDNIINLIKANQEKAEVNLDKALVAILDTIFQEDQKYRIQTDSIEEKYGRKSNEMTAIWKLIEEKDSINLIKVCKILDTHGWLGEDIIGKKGNSTLFYVIQHSNLKIREKYLPMMREAVKKGNAKNTELAMLEDRVAIGKGNKQIYGSQIGRIENTGEFYVLALIAPENINKRRSEIGLGTIQDYVSIWDIIWDLEEYKTKIAENKTIKK